METASPGWTCPGCATPPRRLRPRGSVESSPSLCLKARASSLPRVAAKWAFALWVISLRDSASLACRVMDREAVKQALPAPLHLVAETGDVFQGDLRLGGHGAAPLE